MKKSFAIALCLIISSGVHLVLAAEPTSGSTDELHDRAVGELRRALKEQTRFIKVHAAESLLALGYGQQVNAEFESETQQHGDEPQYRIGIWRVLALANVNKRESGKYVNKIRDAYLDPESPDAVHAVESLAKLRFEIPKEFRERFENLAKDPSAEGAAYRRWVLAVSGNEDEIRDLAELLESPSALVRGATAYALRHLGKKLPREVIEKLAEVAANEPQPDSQIYLVSAAYLTVKDERQASQLKERLLSFVAGTKDEKYEVCAALAVAGDQGDLPLLSHLLEDPNPDVRIGAANAILRIERRKEFSVAWLDWIVLTVYAVGMMLVGWAYSRVKNVEDYLLGGRDMKPWAVGISLFATLMSTLSYLAFPGEIIRHGPMILSGILAYPFAYIVVGRFVIPYIMRLRVTSAYEILERRLGLSVRMLGSALFLVMRLLWMALIVFATSDAVLVPLLHLDQSATPLVCVAMAAITVAYTSMGGLKAVVFTDVLQTFIMLAGAILSLVLITASLGGVAEWWPRVWRTEWDEPSLLFAPDARISAGTAILSAFTYYVCTACSDQMAVQRYLATRDVAAARRMFGVSLVCAVLVSLLLAALGLALFAYFTAHPEMLPDGETVASGADRLLPQYIVGVLPAGIAGLVVAGLLSAAMDSLSSGLNSACSVIVADWIERFRRIKTRGITEVRQAKIVSWSIGLVVIVLSLFAIYVPGNLLEVCFRVVNSLVSPLAVLFFMAMFVPWATAPGTWAAAIASTFVAARIAYWEDFGLSFMWIMPLSLAAGMATGALISALPIGKHGR